MVYVNRKFRSATELEEGFNAEEGKSDRLNVTIAAAHGWLRQSRSDVLARNAAIQQSAPLDCGEPPA